jgi:fructose-specific phosphotransferase system IIC component
VHTAIVFGAIITGGIAHTFIAGPVWVLFGIIDYPESWLFWKQSSIEPRVFFLCLGIIHWGLIGVVIGTVWRWLRREKADA